MDATYKSQAQAVEDGDAGNHGNGCGCCLSEVEIAAEEIVDTELRRMLDGER